MIKAIDYLNSGFSWGQLWYEEFEIQAALGAIKRLINSQEKSLENDKEKFKEALESDYRYQSLDEENKRSYYSQFFDREQQTINEIKRHQRSAVLMTVFSFFEGRLRNICQTIEDENKLSQKLEDVEGGSDIQKLWKFLTDVYKIDKTKVEPYLKLIEDQKFARNRIVHHEGYMSKDQKKRLNLVSGLDVMDYTNNSQIEISDATYLNYLVNQVGGFFKELLLAIDNRHKEINNNR